MIMGKEMILITGPIGAGKSVLSEMVLNSLESSEIEYISTDAYYGLYFRNNNNTDSENYSRAKAYCKYKLNKALTVGKSFMWETVVAKPDKLEFINKCKQNGYKIITLFVGAKDRSIFYNRVGERYKQGWFDVPISKQESRYAMVMDSLPKLIQLSDKLISIDSSDGFKTIFETVNGYNI